MVANVSDVGIWLGVPNHLHISTSRVHLSPGVCFMGLIEQQESLRIYLASKFEEVDVVSHADVES